MTARRTLTPLVFAVIGLTARAPRADVKVVVVGAKLGGSAAGGDPSPDGDGVFFGAGVPVINDAGEVAFYASFTTGSQGTAAVHGNTTPGSLRIVVRQGDPAPDANGNFGVFADADSPPINGAGQMAIPARFVGTFGPNDTSGIVRGDAVPEGLVLLLRQGQTVGGVTVDTLNNPVALNASGNVVIPCLGSFAIFLHGGGTNSLVAHLGGAAPDGGTYVTLPTTPPAINDAGQIAFGAPVSANGMLNVEFVRIENGNAAQVVRHGDPVPDHNGTFDLVLTTGIFRQPALNESGELAFLAAIAGATGPGTQGLFRATDPDHVVTIARRGGATPDANGSFLSFDFSAEDTVALNDAGQGAFRATLTGTAQGSVDNAGIFRSDGSELVRVARKGMPAPDADGVFASFDQPAINAAGQVAFHATLSGTTHTQGIFLYDDVKGLIQVARLGQPLLGVDLVSLRFAGDTTKGRKHLGLNAAGQVAFQFDLADGRRGIAVGDDSAPATTTSTTAIATTSTTPATTSTTSTIPGATTSTSTVPGATTSTSTVLGVTSSTTTLGPVASTTVPVPSTTTTTLEPCATVRCLLDTAVGGPSCVGQTLPASVTAKLDRAITQAEQAPLESGKKATRLYKTAKRLLAKAGRAAAKAARGRHPKLSGECSASLVDAIRQAGLALGSPK